MRHAKDIVQRHASPWSERLAAIATSSLAFTVSDREDGTLLNFYVTNFHTERSTIGDIGNLRAEMLISPAVDNRTLRSVVQFLVGGKWVEHQQTLVKSGKKSGDMEVKDEPIEYQQWLDGFVKDGKTATAIALDVKDRLQNADLEIQFAAYHLKPYALQTSLNENEVKLWFECLRTVGVSEAQIAVVGPFLATTVCDMLDTEENLTLREAIRKTIPKLRKAQRLDLVNSSLDFDSERVAGLLPMAMKEGLVGAEWYAEKLRPLSDVAKHQEQNSPSGTFLEWTDYYQKVSAKKQAALNSEV